MSIKISYQLDSGYFCAGVDIDRGVVQRAAPIIKWMIGKDADFLKEYAKKKGWKITEVTYPCE